MQRLLADVNNVRGQHSYGADLKYFDVEGRQYHMVSEVNWRALTEHLFGAHQLRERDELAEIASIFVTSGTVYVRQSAPSTVFA
ncbi:MAG: hypothetical protein H0U03_01110 [Actinobacteria bacterium]|nr:hypothetical protein [Actinomycetota bacterium]